MRAKCEEYHEQIVALRAVLSHLVNPDREKLESETLPYHEIERIEKTVREKERNMKQIRNYFACRRSD